MITITIIIIIIPLWLAREGKKKKESYKYQGIHRQEMLKGHNIKIKIKVIKLNIIMYNANNNKYDITSVLLFIFGAEKGWFHPPL